MTKKLISYDDAGAAGSRLPAAVVAEIETIAPGGGTVTTLGDLGITSTATELNYTDGVTSAIQTQLNTKATSASPAFTGTPTGITKTHVGLGNVDNVSDATKLADVPRFLVFSTTWPDRPNDDRRTFFLGGATSTDAPSDIHIRTFDIWIPAS